LPVTTCSTNEFQIKNRKAIIMKLTNYHTMKLLFAFLVLSACGRAGILPFHQRLQDTVCTGGKDTLITEVNPKTGAFKDQSVWNFVTVGIDHDYVKYVNDSSVYQVFCTIDGYSASNTLLSTTSHTFTVVFDPFGNAAFRDKDMYKFTGAYKVRVTLTGAKKNGSNITCLPDYLYIDSDIEVERYYDFGAYATSTFTINAPVANNYDCDLGNVPDELIISWNSMLGSGTVKPEFYELEWTFVNDYDSVSGAYKGASALNYNFRGNSTRVQTADNSYRVSLIYEHGYIIFRVRGIGRDTANTAKIITGVWSDAESGTVNTADAYYHNTTVHEGAKNWQYNASFAEEGKKKEVVSYFDGSLRNRQSVTKTNSNQVTLVGETIYDHEGRPAVNVLPVPVDFPTCDSTSHAAILFYPNFNRDDSLNAYSRNDFDVDDSAGSCSISVGPMNTGYGASHYYSPNNPNKSGQQAFVPDAKKYPFTQVEYTPDNTGRIKRQGGVGVNHQLNTTHETTYFYGQPTQIELDRMFGSEVGDASHYKKNVVVDANGQVSLSYLDMAGRTIATALAGDTANGLAKIASNSSPVTLTADLFNKNANGVSGLNTVNLSGNSIEFNSQLLVAYGADHIFTYSLAVDTMADSCLRNSVCFSCVYDLQLRVYDDCGVDLLAAKYGYAVHNRHVGHFTVDSLNKLVFTDSCLGQTTFSSLDTLYLKTGNYTVSKLLTVNQDAVDYYVNKYLDTTFNSCYQDLSDFKSAALAGVDTSGCRIDCQTCLDNLGDRDAFVAEGKGTYAQYDALADECQEPCKEKSDCYIRYLQLVADMSPGGQYADYMDNTGAFDPSAFPLSVFNTSNQLPKNMAGSDTADWRHPRITLNNHLYYEYVDDGGSIATISVSKSGANYLPAVTDTAQVEYDTATASYYTFPYNLANFSDFINSWQPSWARSLVIYHPEYCYYEACKGFSQQGAGEYTSSDDFDALLRTTETFSIALARGFIKYNYTTQAYSARLNDWTDVNDSIPYDPFLNSTTYGNYATQLTTLLTNYTPKPYNLSGYNFSIGEVAAFYTRCGSLFGNADTSGCIGFGTGANDSIKNQEWKTLVSLYLSRKQVLQQQYLDNYVKSSGCPGYSACFGDSSNSFNASSLGSQYSNAGQPCSYITGHLYAGKIRRFAGASFMLGNNVNQMQYQAYLVTGQCPMAYGLQSLLNQLASHSKLKSADSVLLDNYSYYTPDIYLALGGSGTTHDKFFWNSSTSGAVISATFTDILDSTVCSVELDLSVSGYGSLNNYLIIGATGLADTSAGSNPNSFRIYLVLKDTVNDTVLVKLALGHSSCLDIDGCKFAQVCTPNDFASDLQKMMSALAYNHQLAGHYVKLNQSPYTPYVTPYLKNQLGTGTTNALVWNYNATDSIFELYDSAAPSIRLWINLGGDTASIATSHGINFINIYGFKDINSTFYNNFSITALDTVQNDTTLLGCYVQLVDTLNGDSIMQGIVMGSCGYPASFNCQGTPYKLQNDLQLLLRDALVSMPGSHNVDLTKLPSYSQTIANGFPYGLTATTSTVVTNTSGWGDYDQQLLFTVKSTYDSCHFSLNADSIHGFDSIVDFNKLTAYGATDAFGNHHQFYGIATYLHNDSTFTDTIFGQSCLPILNCCACGTDDTVATIEPYTPTDSCQTLYDQLLAAVDTFNADSIHYIYPSSLPAYYEVIYFGYCNCISNYIGYLQNYTDTVNEPYGFLDVANIACPNAAYSSQADKNCMQKFEQYFNLVSQYNNTIPPGGPPIEDSLYTSFSFNTSGFCDCWPGYQAYLEGILNGSIPQSAIDSSIINIVDFCNSNYSVPCQTYVSHDTGSVYPTSIGVPAPDDTSCVKQLMDIAAQNATNEYNIYRDSLTTNIASKYVSHCLGALESFTDRYPDKQYHYTLYYYDQAGNLIRTIPPQGVSLTNVTGPPTVPISVPASAADSICWDRTFRQHLFTTEHTLPTTYLYNSLNQLVKQNMPDHDPIDIWEYTLPNGLSSKLRITGIQFVNENVGYLTGYQELPVTITPGITKRGFLYYSANGGRNWTQVPDLVNAQFNKIQMVTEDVGFAVGKDGLVLKTIDKGVTWDLVPTYPEYTGLWKFTPEWKDLYFSDTTHGIITGTKGKSLLFDLTQSNAANRIKPVSLPGDSTDILTGVTFDGSFAYASSTTHDGFGRIYKSNLNPFTTDSLKWDLVTGISANDLLDVQFTSSNTNKGFISGIKGTLLRTGNGGVTWESVSTGLANDIPAVFFRNDSVGIALVDSAAGKAKMYKTTTGGRVWTLVSSAGHHYNDLAPYVSSFSSTKDKLFAVGNKGIVHRVIATTNNLSPYYGATPHFGIGVLSSPNQNVDFECVAAATYTTSTARPRVVIGADNGKVYYCKKADSTVMVWDSIALSTVAIKKIAVKLIGANNDIQAVGLDANGDIYGLDVAHTHTSTVTYTPSEGFVDIAYNSSAGKFYAYANTGDKVYEINFTTGLTPSITTALKNSNGSIGTVKAVAFTGNHLMVVGSDGDIFKDSLITTTGGTWVDESQSLKLLPLTDIQTDNAASPALYAVGYNGTLVRKPNGGNWTKVATSCNKNFNAIRFKDSNTGIVVGDAMKMYKVDVSGGSPVLTAVTTTVSSTANLRDVDLIASFNFARIVGEGGLVLDITSIISGAPSATRLNTGAITTSFSGIHQINNGFHLVGENCIYNFSMGLFKANAFHTQELVKAHFTTPSNGYVIGDHGFIRHTTDGNTWQVVLPRLQYAHLDTMLNVYTYQASKAILLGKDTFLAKLSGTGTPTFVTTGTSGAPDLYDIDFGDNSPNMGYVVGSNKTAFKLNLPNFTTSSLPALPLSYAYNLHAVHAFLDNSIMAVGSKGAAVFYNAINNTWYRHGLPNPPGSTDSTRYSFNDVYFHDDRSGYVVGDSGVVLRWTSSNNIQKITNNTSSVNTYFAAKPTEDLLGATDSTLFDIKAVVFPTRHKGMIGGSYRALVSSPLYARLVNDESQEFSTHLYYDALGRMVLSQNSKQYAKSPKTYSYTKYDALGRITEVGRSPRIRPAAFASMIFSGRP
jgi:photosystem II stability/assembly factor-like uncharacterized protein